MDEADCAQKHIEAELAALVQRRRPEGPAASGHCLNCDAPTPPGRRWCDADCRDDWERRDGRP